MYLSDFPKPVSFETESAPSVPEYFLLSCSCVVLSSLRFSLLPVIFRGCVVHSSRYCVPSDLSPFSSSTRKVPMLMFVPCHDTCRLYRPHERRLLALFSRLYPSLARFAWFYLSSPQCFVLRLQERQPMILVGEKGIGPSHTAASPILTDRTD